LPEDRLTGSDKRALVLWIICGILGALFAYKYFFRAFPEASVDFKVSRSEAQKRAKEFVEGLGENLNGYQSTITFDVAEHSKTYLERELGLQEANRLMSSELNIWYWEVRFFRPLQEEEFQVSVNPAGKVVGYDHRIEEARGAKSASREEALATAEAFLQTKLGANLSNWEFLPEEANSQARPNRLDWSFTWERKGFKAKEAPYRLQVGLEGDRIGDTREFLRVPEAWSRDYQHLRSTNNLYNEIAVVPYGFLMGAALWLGFSLTRQGKTMWGAALKIGVLVAILFFLMQANEWDSYRAGYDTHESYSSFVTLTLVKILLGALAAALTVSLVLPGGEPLYRASQPKQLRLYKTFTVRGLRSKEFFSSSVVGLSLAAAHIGFIVAFYMIGSQFGVWAPQDLNYSDVVNTSIPWIAGVAIGVMAATSEEFLFRLFAIPFLHKLTGSRIAAVILPAFFWSFLHSGYPQEPGYIRGIEVGLIGIVAGMVMLRWGIVATLIWHYTVDASLVGMLLVRSDNLYFKISGIVVGLAAVAPLALSGISNLLRGQFESVEDLANGADAAPEISLAQPAAEEAALSSRRYSALTTGTIGFLALCVVAGGLLAWRSKRETIGDYLKLTVDARSAVSRADAVLREHGLNPNSYRKAAQFRDTTDTDANEYLRRRMPIAAINQIYAGPVAGALWRVRYFRDSQPEEFAVTLKPDGSVHGFWHTLAEAAKGASVPKQEAQAIAEKFLQEKKQIDLGNWNLMEANSDKRPNRADHTFTWQQNSPLDAAPGNATGKDSADHAYVRMDVHVLGDEPADYRTYLKIPEEFSRKMDEKTLPRTLILVGQAFLALGLAVTVLVFYFKGWRAEPVVHVPWRRMLKWSVVGVVGFFVSFLFGNAIPTVMARYDTALPMKIYFTSVAVGMVLFAALITGALVLIFGFAWYFATRAFGEEQLPTWLGMPAVYYRDAFWIALGGSALLIGLKRFLEVAASWWPTLHRGLSASFGESFDASLPAAGVIGGTLLRGLFYTGILALAGAFLGAQLRVRWLRMLLFLGVAAALVSNWESPADFLKQLLVHAILLGFVVVGIRRVARFNILGYFLVVTCTGLLGGAAALLSQPNPFYRTQGYFVLSGMVLLLAWPLVSWRMGSGKGAQTSPS
jgi:membrane protease YdiL (CAAX protease family)